MLVKPDGTCVIRIARSEMGQGTLTGLAQLVAEELECGWKNVATEFVTPGQNHARKRAWGEMSTGGSRGIRISHDYVRRGGAVARTMLLAAAAEQLKVPVAELGVADGIVTHAATGRKTSYGKLAGAASKLPVPDAKSVKLKVPSEWKLAGKPMKRLDTAAKLDGSLIYAIDFSLPGMLEMPVAVPTTTVTANGLRGDARPRRGRRATTRARCPPPRRPAAHPISQGPG